MINAIGTSPIRLNKKSMSGSRHKNLSLLGTGSRGAFFRGWGEAFKERRVLETCEEEKIRS